jgi:hypothetical protein
MQSVLPRSRVAIVIPSAGIGLFILIPGQGHSLMIQFLSENTFLLRSLPDRQHICPMTGDRSESALMSKLLPRLPKAVAAKRSHGL